MPFDSTTVIPAAWSQHHQAAAAGGMNAAVVIGNPEGEPHYDPETDDTTVTWSQEYVGPARIQEMSQAQQQTDAAGQAVTGRAYLVQLDARHDGADAVLAGMRVRTTASTSDALLLERLLWIVDVPVGSERFTRDLICSDSQADAPAAS